MEHKSIFCSEQHMTSFCLLRPYFKATFRLRLL